jgi:ABC-type transporter Mla subunit MlaD
MTGETLSPFITSLKAEHRELQQMLRQIGDCLAASAASASPRESAVYVEESLQALARHLKHHFEQEEAGGYLEEALAHAPRFGPRASQLLRQHPALLADTTELLDACRTCRDPESWSRFRMKTGRLLKELAAHEAGENQIIQQAFNTDLGLKE